MDTFKFDLVLRKKDSSDASGKTYKKVSSLATASKPVLWSATYGRLGISIKDVAVAGNIAAKKVSIQVFEVSTTRKAHLWLTGIQVAEFDATLKKQGSKFYFDTVLPVKKNGQYTYKLPALKPWVHWYQKKKTLHTGPWHEAQTLFTTGYKQHWKPDWLPVYFQMDFGTGLNSFSKLATIVLPRQLAPKPVAKSQNGHLVRYPYYSIGIKIVVDGNEVYTSRAMYLDFHNILSHNLKIAAQGMLDAHYETLHQSQLTASVGKSAKPKSATTTDCRREALPTTEPFSDKVGTHYGNEYPGFLVKRRNGKIVSGGAKQARFVYKHCKKNRLQHISCMGYPIEVGHLAYLHTYGNQKRIPAGSRAANKTWRAYRAKLPKAKAHFGYIAEALIRAGWTVVYFNPDTSNTHAQRIHMQTAANAARGHYLFTKKLKVHDQMVDYRRIGTLSTEQRRKLKEQLENIKELEFSFLITHGKRDNGSSISHSAMVIKDKVYEVHYTRSPTQWCVFDRDAPLKDWAWGSGILIIPPGQWTIKNAP